MKERKRDMAVEEKEKESSCRCVIKVKSGKREEGLLLFRLGEGDSFDATRVCLPWHFAHNSLDIRQVRLHPEWPNQIQS